MNSPETDNSEPARIIQRINFLDPLLLRDPYPLYRRMLQWEGPHYNHSLNAHLIFDYRTAAAAYASPQVGRVPRKETPDAHAYDDMLSHWLLDQSDAKHADTRSSLKPAFSGEKLSQAAQFLRTAVGERLDSHNTGDTIDFVEAIAAPTALRLVGHILGCPERDFARLAIWADRVAACLGLPLRREAVAEASAAALESQQYFRGLIDARSGEDRDDLIGTFAASKVNRTAAAAQCVLLLTAGYISSRDQLSNTLLALLRNPEHQQAAAHDSARLEAASEEGLRYDGAIQCTGHLALADLELSGAHIKAGERILIFIGAANRDQRVFADPDRFDPGRESYRHIAFGSGSHYCLGAAMFRMETRIVLGDALKRWPQMVLDESGLERRTSELSFRGLRRLPILLR